MCLINAYQKMYVFLYCTLLFNIDAKHNSAAYYLRNISRSPKKKKKEKLAKFCWNVWITNTNSTKFSWNDQITKINFASFVNSGVLNCKRKNSQKLLPQRISFMKVSVFLKKHRRTDIAC